MANVGMLGYIGVGREVTFAASTGVSNYVEALSESMTVTIDRYETKNVIAGLYEPDDMGGVHNVAGDIVLSARGAGVGVLLLSALGARTVTGSAATNWLEAAYVDTPTVIFSRSPPATMVVEVFRPGATNQATSIKYRGCAVDKLSFNIKPNQDLRCTASLIGWTYEYKTVATPTFQSSPVTPFAFDECSLQLNGAGQGRFDEVTVEISNQLEPVVLLDGTKRLTSILPTGPTQIRVGGVMNFQDLTDFTRFVNQTEFSMDLSFFRPNSFSMLFNFPRLVFTEMPIVLSDKGRVTASFSTMARADTSSLSAMSVIYSYVGSS